MTKLNCQTAQERFQELLDRRLGEPLPNDVAEHLQECQPCQSWQLLLHSKPAPFTETLSSSFADRVLQRHQWERRKSRWLRGGSLLALAASLLFAGIVWYQSLPLHTNQHAIHTNELAQQRSKKLLEDVRGELAALQQRASSFQAPTIAIPDTFINWEFTSNAADPLEYGLPALRTIGSSLQGALEPFEAPAKAAYSKVKSVIDDPELKKWMQKFNNRST